MSPPLQLALTARRASPEFEDREAHREGCRERIAAWIAHLKQTNQDSRWPSFFPHEAQAQCRGRIRRPMGDPPGPTVPPYAARRRLARRLSVHSGGGRERRVPVPRTRMALQAAPYRERHVLLAGDAAHVHPRWLDRASTSVCRMQ